MVESVKAIIVQSIGGPSVSSLSPSSAFAGGGSFTLAVNGTGFVGNVKSCLPARE